MTPRILAGAALGAVLLAPAARADLVVERTVREYGPEPAGQEAAAGQAAPAPEAAPEIVELSAKRYEVKMASHRLRETCHEDKTATVVRLDRHVVWLLDLEANTYRELSFQSLAAAAAKTRRRLARRLPLVSDPELRRKLGQTLGAEGRAAELSIEKPGRTKQVAGEACELVVVRLGGDELFSAWVSRRPSPLRGTAWLRLGGLFSEADAAKLAEIRGMVLEGRFELGGGRYLLLTTESLAERPVDRSEYENPAAQGFSRFGGEDQREEKGRDKGKAGKRPPPARAPAPAPAEPEEEAP